MKLFNYELDVINKFYIYDYLEKYATFENFLDNYSYIHRELSGNGEYLTFKKSRNSNEENMSLCNLTITIDTCCLANGADFILWQNSECIMLEGYSYEDKWLRPECEIKIK
ncbi:MAG TPA: hypothetical protein EYG98_02310 [Sulfurovum sp.]|nr:hypothetical protein [Sulfurovum sp.]